MHAGTIIPQERLGHERRGHATPAGDVLHHVFVDHHPVGHLCQRGEAHVDFALAPRRHFMVVSLYRDAELLKEQHDLTAHVLQGIGRRNREISFLGAQLVSEARAIFAAPHSSWPPRSRFRNSHSWAPVVAHLIEYKMLQLGAEVGGVADCRRLKVSLGLLRDVPHVAAISSR